MNNTSLIRRDSANSNNLDATQDNTNKSKPQISHSLSSTVSYSTESKDTALIEAISNVAQVLTQNEEASNENWSILNLIDKQQIVPCDPEMLKEFESYHKNSLEASKHRKYFWIGAGGISLAEEAIEHYGSSYPIVSVCVSIALKCTSHALDFFFSKAQSDYSVNVKADLDKQCQNLKKLYDNTGRGLIVKYIKSTSTILDLNRDEKANGDAHPGHQRKLSEKSEVLINYASDLVNNWKNIISVSAKCLFIDSDSAGDAMHPLHEAAMTIISDNLKQKPKDTIMQAFFNEQTSKHAIEQKEIQKNKDDEARLKQMYQYINENKELLEKGSDDRLQGVKIEIEATAKKYAEAASREIETAKNEAINNASEASSQQLQQLKIELEKQFLEVMTKANSAANQALTVQNQANEVNNELNKKNEEIENIIKLNCTLVQEINDLRTEHIKIVEAFTDLVKEKEKEAAQIDKITFALYAKIEETEIRLSQKMKKKKKPSQSQLNDSSSTTSIRQCCPLKKVNVTYSSKSKY